MMVVGGPQIRELLRENSALESPDLLDKNGQQQIVQEALEKILDLLFRHL